MRYPIWKKNDYFQQSDKILQMDPVVVELPKGEVPLSWQYNHDHKPLGLVSGIKLEDDEITGEVTWFADSLFSDDEVEKMRCRLGGYYIRAFYNGDKTEVTSAVLVSVSVIFEDQAPIPREFPERKTY